MIRFDDVTLTYPDGASRVIAVDHVDLEARPGLVTGITGPSGSGKSSVLAVAATLARPDSGRVTIDAIDVTALSRRDSATLRRERIGLVFQQPQLLAALTVREQLAVMAELGGTGVARRRARVRRRIDGVLADVGLERLADRRPAQLSGGQRQRAAIARAIVHEPRVLLVDEPTSALDHARGAEVMDLVHRLTHERDMTTLLVTHDLIHAGRLDERIDIVDGRRQVVAQRVNASPAS